MNPYLRRSYRLLFAFAALLLAGVLPATAAEDAFIVRDIRTGTNSSSPTGLTVLGQNVYFNANDGTTGNELWMSDGTNAGTVIVQNINAGGNSSAPTNLASTGTFLFFVATNGSTGAEPFASTGVAGNAQLLLDVRPGGTGSTVANQTVVGSKVFFTANDNSTGIELYVTDGTPGGTLRPKDIRTGAGNSSTPLLLTALGNLVVFEATDGATGIEPYVSNGTNAGTFQLLDVRTGANSSDPTEMVAVPGLGLVFFDANAAGTIGRELYKTNGTAAGTALVSNINSGANNGNPTNLASALDKVFFSADSGGNGIEPYVSDGTTTTQLMNIMSGGGDSNPDNFTEAGGIVYFSADGANGIELYKTDGTPAGTSLVEDLRSGGQDSSPSNFHAFGTKLFFTANDGGGVEPWISDGTAGGTFRLANINTGGSSNPGNIVVTPTYVYFTADDNAATGIEWWRTDGTAAGTIQVHDIRAGGNDAAISGPVLCDEFVIFSASDGTAGSQDGQELWAIEYTYPTTTSIVRASANPTNAASVNFTVTFSEGVTGVNTGDFVLTTTGLTGASVTSVTPVNSTTYTVAVNTGTGAGTLRLDIDDNDSIVDMQGSANPLGGTGNNNGDYTAGEVYTIDRLAPSVTSITLANPNPTIAPSVNYTVQFSEDVTGVNAADFTLTTAGITGASITGVTQNTASNYTVTVSTGSGSGTIRLDVTDNDSIIDGFSNPLGGAGAGNGNYTAGPSYTVDHVSPTVQSIVRADANPTNASSVNFTVTFSETVSGVSTDDFALTISGLSGMSVSGITPVSGSVYTVTVNTGTGSGTLRLDLIDDDSIADSVGNLLGGVGAGNGTFTAGQSYTLERVAPSVVSVVRNGASPTNAASVTYTVTFSENVTGVNNGDFSLTTTGVTGASVSGTAQVTPSTYTVTVNTGAGSGTIRLDVTDNDSIIDAVTNPLGGAGAGNGNFTTGEVYTIDKTAPAVTSIVRVNASPTNAASVAYTVTFTENVTGVNGTDFTLTTTGVAGTSVGTVTQVTPATYTVNVNTGTGSGTIRLDFVDNNSVTDSVGNATAIGFTTGEVYTIDRTGPTVSSINRLDTDPTSAATVDYLVTFSENVTGVDATDFTFTLTGGVAGATVASVTQNTPSTYNVSVNTGTGAGTLRLNFTDNDSVIDSLSNPAGGAGAGNANFTTGQVYTIDRTAPTVSSIVRASGNPTAAASVNFTVTFSENVTGVDTADFAVDATGLTGSSVTTVTPVSGTVYTVAVNTGSGSGTLGMDLVDDDSIADTAGNQLGGVGAGNGSFTGGQTYTVDRQPPTVVSIVRNGASPTNAASVSYTVTFSENVTGVGTSDFTLTTTGVTGTSVSGTAQVTPSTYTVTVNTGSGSGTIRLDLTDNDSIQDSLNNRLGGTGNGNGNFNTGEVYTIDRTAPAVSSIVRINASPTNAASVAYTVTFTETVTGVNGPDFTLTTTGVAGTSVGTVTQVTPATYTVNVNTGTGSGTIRLDFVDNNSVTDSVGNTTAAGFTTGEVYTIDRSGPTVSSINRLDTDPTAAASVDYLVTFSENVTGVDAADFTFTLTGGVAGATVASVTQNTPSTYNVSINTGTGSGTVRLNFTDNDTVLDSLGNPAGGTGAGNGNFTGGQSYTIDRTGPEVNDITRAGGTPTTNSSVSFFVTFDEGVNGVNAGDFVITTTGTLSGTSITSVIQVIIDTLYLVTVNTGTGSGTLRVDLVDDDSITDDLGNPLGGTGAGNGNFSTGEEYVIDRTVPVVSSIVRASGDPTNSASVAFTVAFSEDVTGVNTADFVLTTTGVTGATISSVTQVTPDVYTVAVGTGAGSGTIRLDVTDDDSIRDLVNNRLGGTGNGNGNFTTGQFYTIDRDAPSVSSINRSGGNPTGAASIAFTATFSENVTGVDTTDFTLATTGVTGASVASVTAVNGSTYTVNVNTGTGSGTIRLNLTDDDSVRDIATNRLGGTGAGNGNFTGQQYTIDKTVPVVSSIARQSANPTSAASVDYLVTFSEDVSGVDAADFALTTTGSLSGTTLGAVTQTTASTYTVTVNTGTGNGTIRLDFADDDSVVDTAANPVGSTGAGNGDFTTGEEYTVDRTVPTVSSIVRVGANPTNAASVDFTVTFSEDVTGVQVGDFLLTTTGVTGASISSRTQITPSTYTVTVATGSGDGTIRLDVDDNDSIQDGAGNQLGGAGVGNGSYTAGEVYTVDKSIPAVQSVVRADGNPTNAASVNFTVTFSENVTGVNAGDFSLTTTGVTGASVTSRTQVTPSVYTVTVNTGSGDGTIRLDVDDNDSIVDSANNALGGAGNGNGAFTTGQSYTVDKSAPSVTGVTRVDANPTNANSVQFDVALSEDVMGVDISDFTLTTTGLTGTSISGVSETAPNSYRVTVNTGTGNGTIRLDVLDDDSIVDGASNALTAAFTGGQVYTVDKSAPAVLSIVRADANPTNAATVDFTVTFSEDVTGVGPGDFALTTTGVSGATIDTRTQVTPSVYTITVSTGTGTGTIRLDLADNDSIRDAINNPLGGTGVGNGDFTSGEEYTIDRTAPSVVSIVRAGSNPTNAAVVEFNVTFNEDVTGVNAGDFELTTTGVTGANILSRTQVTPSIYSVNVNTGTGAGTVRLDLDDNDSIRDAINTPLGGTGNDNGDFIGGEVYTVDKSTPSVTGIARANANPTNAATVGFDVEFSENVAGVDTTDFTLTITGVIGASVTGVVVNSASNYRVSVNTGSGNGTIRLDLVDDDSVGDLASNRLGGPGAGNGNATNGQVYTIQKNVPTVSSITRLDANPTNAAAVAFSVVFSENVTGVNNGDFTLTASGISGASVASVSQNTPSTYTVNVNTGTGSGTLRLDVIDNDSIVDITSNPLGGVGVGNGNFTTGEAYTVDKDVAVVTAITRISSNPTNASSVNFEVTFNKDVTGVGLDDFALDVLGVTGSAVVSVTQITPSSYDVAVSLGTGEGTVKLVLNDNDTILDGLNQPLGGTGAGNGDFTGGESFTVDLTGPGITIGGPSPASTVSGPVTYTVQFTGASSVVLNDSMITVNTTGTAVGTATVSGSGTASRLVTLTGVSGEGTLSISIDAAASFDAATNASLAAGPSATVDVSATPSVPVNPWLLLAAMLAAFGGWAVMNRRKLA